MLYSFYGLLLHLRWTMASMMLVQSTKKGTGVKRDMTGGMTIALEEVVFSEAVMCIILLFASSLFLN